MPLVCLKLIVYPSPWVEAKLSDNFFYGAFWLLVGPFTTDFKPVHAERAGYFSHGVYSFFSARKVILWYRFHHLESWFFCWHGFIVSPKDEPARLRPQRMFWQVNFKTQRWVVFRTEMAEIQVPIWQALALPKHRALFVAMFTGEIFRLFAFPDSLTTENFDYSF